MICRTCNCRFAPYPQEDFKFIKEIGFVSKTKDAEEKRHKVFESNERNVCEQCIQDAGETCHD